ncbi:MerR family transcriptional regulator [Litoribacter populi]|uniref:transcriptional regulator n=1 Tax=Litoribacter populi TaxID=2598460 RepID=UPI00117D71FF|nr:transcriptional regulator [Litoribacter populi]
MATKGLTNAQKKDWAKTLITKEKLTQKEAALKVGVSPQTMNKWYKEEGWEKLQRNFLLTREEQMSLLLEELVEINEFVKTKEAGQRFADSKLGDVRRKLVKDIKELETSAALPEIIHACTQLLEFIRKVDLEKAQELSRYVDAFIKSKL